MDDDSDVEKDLDNSLGDLDPHLGLDSSLEGSTGGLEISGCEEPSSDRGAEGVTRSVDGPAQNQVAVLQDMVEEMKQGFHAAVQELAKLQQQEETDGSHSRNLQHQQQRQLDELTDTIQELKTQLGTLTASVEEVRTEQKATREVVEKGQLERNELKEQMAGLLKKQRRRELPEESMSLDLSALPSEWKDKALADALSDKEDADLDTEHTHINQSSPGRSSKL